MIWLWLACAGTDTNPDSELLDTGASLPGAEQPTTEPVWDAAELEAELIWLLSQGFPNSRQAMGLYLDILSHGDSVCPGNAEYIDETMLRGCTAETGYYFSGVSTYERQSLVDEDGLLVSYQGCTGDYLFRDPAGQEMEAGGHQTQAIWETPQGQVQQVLSEHSGSFVWAGHEGVYREKVSGSLHSVAVISDGQRQLYLQGAISYLDHALYLQTGLLADCGWRTESGVIEVRDPSGGWFTLGPQSCESDCMGVTFGGEPMGEICVDLSPIAQAFEPELEMLQ